MATKKFKPVSIVENNKTKVLRELKQEFSSPDFKIQEVGKGAAGIVYRVSKSEVVKVIPAQKYMSHLKWYKKLFSGLEKMYSRYPRMKPYRQFHTHSTFTFSDLKQTDSEEPLFIYEKMQYLPTNLFAFAKSLKWDLQTFIIIICQVMHGLRLFHQLQYIITDLKLQNVMFDPISKQLKLIDFNESYNSILDNKNYMHTYQNRNAKKHTKKEDVWRLGILMISFILPKVNHYLQKNGKPKLENFIKNMKNAVGKKTTYEIQLCNND